MLNAPVPSITEVKQHRVVLLFFRKSTETMNQWHQTPEIHWKTILSTVLTSRSASIVIRSSLRMTRSFLVIIKGSTCTRTSWLSCPSSTKPSTFTNWTRILVTFVQLYRSVVTCLTMMTSSCPRPVKPKANKSRPYLSESLATIRRHNLLTGITGLHIEYIFTRVVTSCNAGLPFALLLFFFFFFFFFLGHYNVP
jgi:hypothetical protein